MLNNDWQVLCALLNHNAGAERFAYLDARRVLVVADAQDGDVSTSPPLVETFWPLAACRSTDLTCLSTRAVMVGWKVRIFFAERLHAD